MINKNLNRWKLFFLVITIFLSTAIPLVNAADVTEVEPNDSVPMPVNVGDKVFGEIANETDVDYYNLTLAPNEGVTIGLTALQDDLDLVLLDESFGFIDAPLLGGNAEEYITYDAPGTTTNVIIFIEGYYGATSIYELEIVGQSSQIDEYENNDEFANATMIYDIWEPITASVSNNDDIDYYNMTVERGKTFYFDFEILEVTGPSDSVEIEFAYFNEAGIEVESGSFSPLSPIKSIYAGSKGSDFISPDLENSHNYSIVISTDATETNIQYIMSIAIVDDFGEPNEYYEIADQLYPDQFYECFLGDWDYYRFQTTPGIGMVVDIYFLGEFETQDKVDVTFSDASYDILESYETTGGNFLIYPQSSATTVYMDLYGEKPMPYYMYVYEFIDEGETGNSTSTPISKGQSIYGYQFDTDKYTLNLWEGEGATVTVQSAFPLSEDLVSVYRGSNPLAKSPHYEFSFDTYSYLYEAKIHIPGANYLDTGLDYYTIQIGESEPISYGGGETESQLVSDLPLGSHPDQFAYDLYVGDLEMMEDAYEIVETQGDVFIHNDHINHPMEITPGDYSMIWNDVDYYKLDTNSLTSTYISVSASQMDLDIYIYDQNHNFLVSSSQSSLDGEDLTFNIGEDIYFSYIIIEIRGWEGHDNGSYSLNIVVSEYTPDKDPFTGETLVDMVVTGAIIGVFVFLFLVRPPKPHKKDKKRGKKILKSDNLTPTDEDEPNNDEEEVSSTKANPPRGAHMMRRGGRR